MLSSARLLPRPVQLVSCCRRAARNIAATAMAQAHVFIVNPKSKIVLSQGDITRFEGDAIVNAANERMLGGGGVDGAIHRAAGPELYEECLTVPQVERNVRCPTGEARITKGYLLPAKHVIHTVGPVYESEEESSPLLSNAYKNAMKLANENGIRTIAFPAISTGVFGYPKNTAAEVSLKAVKEQMGTVEEVHFVLFDHITMDAWIEAAKKMFSPDDYQVL